MLNGEGPVVGLDGASGVAVSPDGRPVYATAGLADAVTVFARDPASGVPAFVELESGDPLLDGAVEVAVSLDGARVYVIAQGATGGVRADALLTYARDAATGALSREPAPAS